MSLMWKKAYAMGCSHCWTDGKDLLLIEHKNNVHEVRINNRVLFQMKTPQLALSKAEEYMHEKTDWSI